MTCSKSVHTLTSYHQEGLTKPTILPHSFNTIASILTAPPCTGTVTLDVGEALCPAVLLAGAVVEDSDPVVGDAVGVESARDLQACPGDKVAVGNGMNVPCDVLESCELLSGTSGVSGSGLSFGRSFGLGSTGLGAGAGAGAGNMGSTGPMGSGGRGMRGGGGIKAADDVATRKRHSRECGNILTKIERPDFGCDGEI
jgi:hypothetical protein